MLTPENGSSARVVHPLAHSQASTLALARVLTSHAAFRGRRPYAEGVSVCAVAEGDDAAILERQRLAVRPLLGALSVDIRAGRRAEIDEEGLEVGRCRHARTQAEPCRDQTRTEEARNGR